MSEQNYIIKYKKGDFEVELQGDKAWVEAKFKELTTTEIVKPTSTAILISKTPSFPESLAEFVKSKWNPKKHSVLVVLFGYWLYHKENQKAFNSKDIKKCYDDARIQESSNTSQYLGEAQGSGFFKRLDEKKDELAAWTITQTGDRFVVEESWKTALAEDEKTVKRKKTGRSTQTVIPILLDLKAKDSKPSLRDFYKQKKAGSLRESVTVFAYYLKEYLKIEKIEAGHVASCCKEVGIKVPTSIPQMFYDIQHENGWLNLGDGRKFAEINTAGENFVIHDLPRKENDTGNKTTA